MIEKMDPNNVDHLVGSNLLRHRCLQGKTEDQLAQEANADLALDPQAPPPITGQDILDYESGAQRPHPVVLNAILKSLGLQNIHVFGRPQSVPANDIGPEKKS